MFYKKHQHTRHEFSALCKCPLSMEWTQIKINHPSHHGDISIVHTQGSGQHQDHTLHPHFTLSSKRFSVTISNIFQSIQQGLNIHSTNFHNHKSVPGSSQKDTACPLQGLMNLWAKRTSNHKIRRQ